MIDGRHFFNQPLNDNLITYDNIQKIGTSQGDYYTTDFVLDYPYFKNYCKMIVIDLSKQQALYTDPKAIQLINFTSNLQRDGNKQCLSLLKKWKKPF